MSRFFILSTFFVGTCFVEALADTNAPLCPESSVGHTIQTSIWEAHDTIGAALTNIKEIKRKVKELKDEDFDEAAHWCKSPSELNALGHTMQQSAWAIHDLSAILMGHLEEIKADLNDIQAQQR